MEKSKVSMIFGLLALASLPYRTLSECINACSGHGTCVGVRDYCECYNKWMGPDCSQRQCPFGFTYADTPKGDLDASGTIEPYYVRVGYESDMYPDGTSEQWPNMINSRGEVLDNTAHWYRECSNWGTCNRKTGECECLEGFEGTYCQREQCPGYPDNVCGGRGECLPIEVLANADYGNPYKMWDRRISRGCMCDYGYSGGMCEIRACRKGVDPLYIDDVQTVRYPIFNLAIMTSSATIDFTDGFAQPGTAYLKVKFYDQFGRPWLTEPLIPGTFTCSDLVAALEAIPNNAVPSGGTVCTQTTIVAGNPLTTAQTQWDFTYSTKYNFLSTNGPKSQSFRYRPMFWDAGFFNSYDADNSVVGNVVGDIYRLEFYNNPGVLRPLEVETFLFDGSIKPSTVSSGQTIFRSWTDGQQGEDNDYFSNYCKGVHVRIAHSGGVYYLTGFKDANMRNLLKTCLGQSDFDPTSILNDVYSWEYGSTSYPHFIRLVHTVTDTLDSGYYVAMYFDTSIFLDNLGVEGTFRLMQPFSVDYNGADDHFDVFTTQGVLTIASTSVVATFDFASNIIYTGIKSNTLTVGTSWHGDMSCEVNIPSDQQKWSHINFCLNKTDIIVLMDPAPANVDYNPRFINMYTIQRIYAEPTADQFNPSVLTKYFTPTTRAGYLYDEDYYNANVIVTDITTNWATTITGAANFRIYRFYPNDASTYSFVSQCSNRGICNTYDGICDCFSGFEGEMCEIQDVFAV